MKKLPKRFCRVMRRVALTVVLVLVVILLALPNVAVKVINARAGDFVNAEVSVKDIDLHLLTGYLAIDELHVGQPEGFEGGPLLNLPHLHAKVRVLPLLFKRVNVRDVVVDGLTANIIKNADGIMNVAALLKNPPPPREAVPEEEAKPAAAPPVFKLKHLLVDDLTVRYVDASSSRNTPFDVGVSNLVLTVTDLRFDADAKPKPRLPTHVKLTAKLTQGRADDAHLGAIARLGVLSTNTPAVNAAVRLIGLDLDGFRPILPRGVGTGIAAALGGSSMDLEVDVAMSPEVRNIDAVLVNKTARLKLPTRGGLDNIVKDLSGLLSARVAGQVASLAGGVGSAGTDVAGTAIKSAGDVAKGAGKLAGNLGSGLFKMVKGASKGDLKSVGAALKDTTTGAVKDAVSTVTNTASTAVSGVGEAAGKGLGTTSAEAWRTNAPARWAAEWARVVERVEGMPYPTAADPNGTAANTSREVR